MQPPVVILGLSANGLGVVRSLSPPGVDVYGVYSDPLAEIGRHSRQLRARYRVADPKSAEAVHAVLRQIRTRTGDANPVLIATSDTYAHFIAQNESLLADRFILRTAPASVQEAFLDKRSTIDICRENGIPIPRSLAPADVHEVDAEAGNFVYPVIIKPSRTDGTAFPGKNVVVDGADQLVAFYRARPELAAQSVFQELIPSGDGHIVVTASYSDMNASVLALYSGRKIRQWLPDVGVASFSVSETMPELQEMTRSLLEAIGYVGHASIEFAEHRITGEKYFLELNPRVIYHNRLFADAGVDLIKIGYLEMSGDPAKTVGQQRDGVYWIDIHRDIPSILVRLFRRQSSLAGILGALPRTTSFAVYDREDLRPFLASLIRMLAIGFGFASGKQTQVLGTMSRSIRRRLR